MLQNGTRIALGIPGACAPIALPNKAGGALSLIRFPYLPQRGCGPFYA
ncbi:MAG: hypothetical protein ACI9W4_001079 [Rhodothermales bacterium]|jgi:hypothetical protein